MLLNVYRDSGGQIVIKDVVILDDPNDLVGMRTSIPEQDPCQGEPEEAETCSCQSYSEGDCQYANCSTTNYQNTGNNDSFGNSIFAPLEGSGNKIRRHAEALHQIGGQRDY